MQKILGYVKTLSQKLSENPNIDKLIGAVDFWAITCGYFIRIS